MKNLLTDIDGVNVGHADDAALASGVTAILFDKPAVASVDVRGGGPGTREDALLDPVSTVEAIDAITFAGGSAFGLDAGGGVQAWLAERGRGFRVRDAVVPIVTGAIYPLLITAAGRALFPRRAEGSIIMNNGKPVGSALIGQEFKDPAHFWGRPSATGGHPYNAAASSGSNLGPTNPALAEQMRSRVAEMQRANGGGTVPIELVTASGSGLDPHISPAAARYQIPRVAKAAGLPEDAVRKLVDQHTESRQFGILGEPRVNVLELNLALDAMRNKTS